MGELDVRQATAEEFAVAIEWAAGEGWNPGLDDLGAFLAADIGGFLLGYLDSEPVAAISVVQYGNSFGFLGFYIVQPAHRGQGLGLEIWDQGMARLSGRTVGLDGVVEQQENYRKSGFVLADQNIRFSGKLPAAAKDDGPALVRALRSSDVPHVVSYDRPFFPDDRSGFVENWIAPASTGTRQCVVAEMDGNLVGYGVIRACRNGHKVGPLFANDPAVAEQVFSALASIVPETSDIILDVPASNREAINLATRRGLKPTFETARMYRGVQPDLPIDRTFGITTFELG